MTYKKTTLRNGLRILTVPMKGTKTATIMIMVGVGSRYETEKEAGISHFIEHMMFKGTKKRPTTLDISSELDSVGGEFNAFTSKDVTGYYAKVDSRHIEMAMDVITDMYLNSKIEEKEIEREKGTIIQEISMYEDTPLRDISNVFESLLYDNSLGRDILGYKKTVGGFSRKDFMSYLKRYYLPNDTIVCVSGKIEEKEIIKKLKKYFSGMQKGSKPTFQAVVENQKKNSLKIKEKKTDQTHLSLGVRTFDYNHKDRFILSVLSTILGGNMSSRMFIEVRERRGLAYSVHTFLESFADCGYLTTQAGVEHKNLELTLKTILGEYRKMTKDFVSEKELKEAKEYLKGKLVMNFESTDEITSFYIGQEIKGQKIREIKDIFALVDKVTKEDILRLAQKIFSDGQLNLAIIGPHKNSAQLEKILKL